MPHFQFLDDLKRELPNIDEFVTLLKVVCDHPQDHLGFKIHNDLLLYKGHIWLNWGNSFIPLLLEEYNKSPLGGHTGLAKTMSRFQQNFFWANMRRDIQEYIMRYSNCHYTKYIPQNPWWYFNPCPLHLDHGKIWHSISWLVCLFIREPLWY